MSAISTAIDHSPEWEPPDDDELAEVTVEKKFQTKLFSCFDGLTRVTVKGIYRDSKDAKISQKVCVMEVKKGGPNKIPGVPKELLAKAIVARSTEFAEHVGVVVTFKVIFYGHSDANGGRFQVQSSFTVDGRPDDSVDDDDEEDEVEEPQSEQQDSTVRGRSPTHPADPNPPRVLHPALGPARVLTRSPQDVILEMFKIQQEQSGAVFAELRASMAQQRADFSDALKAQTESASRFFSDIREHFVEQRKDLEHARGEVNRSNSRVVNMSEQMAANAQGQQEATRRGWEAFQQGMQMKMEAIGQNMAWERQFMLMNFESFAREQKKEEDESPGWIKEYGPLLFAGIGQVMSGLGHPMGDQIQELATNAMVGDEEEEAEEVSSPVMGVPPKADVGKHFDKNQLASMLQMFNTSLSDEQKATLEKSLPAMAFQNWKSALKSTNEIMTKTYLIQFGAAVNQVKGLQDKLESQMTSDQRELFGDIFKYVRPKKSNSIIDTEVSTPPKREPPPPPPAPPAPPKAAGEEHAIPPLDPKAPVREIRKYAKRHYNIDLPKGSKEEVLRAIKQAKVE